MSEQNKPSLEETREDIIKNLISEKMSSDDKFKLAAVENVREEFYGYLKEHKIEEMLVDTKFSSESYETKTLNGKISTDFSTLILNIYNNEYIMTEYIHELLADYNGEYILYNKETQMIYDLKGLSLREYVLGKNGFEKEQLDLSKYTIIDRK